MSKIAFLGLGVMGYPMAGHIAAAGHEVTVYNRTTARAEAWVAEHGGRHAPTPAAAAGGASSSGVERQTSMSSAPRSTSSATTTISGLALTSTQPVLAAQIFR